MMFTSGGSKGYEIITHNIFSCEKTCYYAAGVCKDHYMVA